MSIARRIKHAFRGQVTLQAALLEISRRGCVALRSRYERSTQTFEKPGAYQVRLSPQFANTPTAKLLEHFRSRSIPRFLPGFEANRETISELQRKEFPVETATLLDSARRIAKDHRWPLLGYGELSFGPEIDWLRDPVSGVRWSPDSHSEAALNNATGGDVRVLWELNRLGHLITLAQAFVVTGDESFAEEFFVQVRAWSDQNQMGFGPNWNCAMEVALRAMNLLVAFQLLRGAKGFTEERLTMMLTLFEQHGRYIRRHLEFSYIATSNHYLSDVVGLLWLGVCLPELEEADEWREFGLREMLREMDKQVSLDGAHYESSTGYHRFVLELFTYSFILCRTNSIEIRDDYWQKLRSMVEYVLCYLRPDGEAPLIGDADSGLVMPIAHHSAADHGYLLGIAATLFNEPAFKINNQPTEEILWLLGEEALRTFRGLATAATGAGTSAGFSQAGTFILRDRDAYLLFNVSGAGLSGRGSHGHNDALSLEVTACGTSFISDPGTYVYTGDLSLRHQFRSTGYHSTVEVDGREQNTTYEGRAFYIGDEARPRTLHWDSNNQLDLVIAEHYGYKNLPNGEITHRRAVMFEKMERYWLIEDTLSGSGSHTFRFCFHIAPGLEFFLKPEGFAELQDKVGNARLLIIPLALREGPPEFQLGEDSAESNSKSVSAAERALKERPTVEPRWFSRDYGAKVPSVAVCWTVVGQAGLKVRWLLMPICAGEDKGTRLALVERLRTTISCQNGER
jgi:hypothetical protein